MKTNTGSQLAKDETLIFDLKAKMGSGKANRLKITNLDSLSKCGIYVVKIKVNGCGPDQLSFKNNPKLFSQLAQLELIIPNSNANSDDFLACPETVANAVLLTDGDKEYSIGRRIVNWPGEAGQFSKIGSSLLKEAAAIGEVGQALINWDSKHLDKFSQDMGDAGVVALGSYGKEENENDAKTAQIINQQLYQSSSGVNKTKAEHYGDASYCWSSAGSLAAKTEALNGIAALACGAMAFTGVGLVAVPVCVKALASAQMTLLSGCAASGIFGAYHGATGGLRDEQANNEKLCGDADFCAFSVGFSYLSAILGAFGAVGAGEATKVDFLASTTRTGRLLTYGKKLLPSKSTVTSLKGAATSPLAIHTAVNGGFLTAFEVASAFGNTGSSLVSAAVPLIAVFSGGKGVIDAFRSSSNGRIENVLLQEGIAKTRPEAKKIREDIQKDSYFDFYKQASEKYDAAKKAAQDNGEKFESTNFADFLKRVKEANTPQEQPAGGQAIQTPLGAAELKLVDDLNSNFDLYTSNLEQAKIDSHNDQKLQQIVDDLGKQQVERMQKRLKELKIQLANLKEQLAKAAKDADKKKIQDKMDAAQLELDALNLGFDSTLTGLFEQSKQIEQNQNLMDSLNSKDAAFGEVKFNVKVTRDSDGKIISVDDVKPAANGVIPDGYESISLNDLNNPNGELNAPFIVYKTGLEGVQTAVKADYASTSAILKEGLALKKSALIDQAVSLGNQIKPLAEEKSKVEGAGQEFDAAKQAELDKLMRKWSIFSSLLDADGKKKYDAKMNPDAKTASLTDAAKNGQQITNKNGKAGGVVLFESSYTGNLKDVSIRQSKEAASAPSLSGSEIKALVSRLGDSYIDYLLGKSNKNVQTLFGPPGTGKTVAFEPTVFEVLHKIRSKQDAVIRALNGQSPELVSSEAYGPYDLEYLTSNAYSKLKGGITDYAKVINELNGKTVDLGGGIEIKFTKSGESIYIQEFRVGQAFGKPQVLNAKGLENFLNLRRNINMVFFSGSTIQSSYVGGTARNINNIMATMLRNANKQDAYSLVFMDEIDSLLPTREALGIKEWSIDGVNAWLAAIGKQQGPTAERVLLNMQATNFPSKMDPTALDRSTLVAVRTPSKQSIVDYLKTNLKGYESKSIVKSLQLDNPAKSPVVSMGYRKANDLLNLVRDAADNGLADAEFARQLYSFLDKHLTAYSASAESSRNFGNQDGFKTYLASRKKLGDARPDDQILVDFLKNKYGDIGVQFEDAQAVIKETEDAMLLLRP